MAAMASCTSSSYSWHPSSCCALWHPSRRFGPSPPRSFPCATPSSLFSQPSVPSTSSSLLSPAISLTLPFSQQKRRLSQRDPSSVRCMAPDEEKMTRRSPLDFPIEWERPRPGRRPDIFPQFSPLKTPLPQPLPADPPEEDEEEEEKKEEEQPEEDQPDKKPEE